MSEEGLVFLVFPTTPQENNYCHHICNIILTLVRGVVGVEIKPLLRLIALSYLNSSRLNTGVWEHTGT
jgi:hypothetical protein